MMRYTHHGRRADYWTVFGVFDVASLRASLKGADSLEAAQLARAVGELAHAYQLSYSAGLLTGHMLPVADAALKRSAGDTERALELATVFYHVLREVVGRNLARETRFEGRSPHVMFSGFASYATILLGMDEMVDLMEHLSPGGDPPVELLAALFL